jgi:undecaprenyl diphosphate synthase
VRQLTVFSFSTENWSRPADEVTGLMDLLAETIDNEVDELGRQGVRLVFVGRREALPAGLQEGMRRAEAVTAENERLILFVALNYGGRAEILDALAQALAAGGEAATLEEEDVSAHLYSPAMRDADLIIRTSGERRLSNFLLWQSAYAELYFSDALWPDFGEADLEEALRDYARRERRFGRREGHRA